MTRGADVRHTICRACHAQCGLLVEMENGRPSRIYGDKDNPIYHGFSCIKGRELYNYHVARSRLLHSQKRRPDGGHAPIASGQAMDEMADKVRQLVAEYGPRSVALYIGTHGYNNFAAKSFAEAFFAAIGSPMVFTSVTIDQPGKAISLMMHGPWLAGAPTIEHWDLLTLIGTNPIVSMNGGLGMNPAKRLHDARARGMKLLVIDPRRTDCAELADLHLALKPGEDAAVLASIAHVLIGEGLIDRDFITAETQGFEALKAAVAPFDPVSAGARAGLDPGDIIAAARMIGSARKGAFSAGTGANMAGQGNLVEYFVKVLTSIRGFWRRAGDEIPNPGVLIHPFPAIAASPGPSPVTGGGYALRVRDLTECAAGLPTAGLAEEILTPGEGQVKALFVLGGNPVLAWPDQILTVEAMKALELLVCFDPQMSATGKMAHYVVAPTLPLEVCGPTALNEMVGNFGPGWGYDRPYAQWSEPLVSPPAGSDVLDEWAVFHGLADRLAVPLTIKPSTLLDPAAAAQAATTVPPGTALDPLKVWDMVLKASPVPFDEVRQTARSGRVFERAPVTVQPRPADWSGRLQIGAPPMMAELARVAARSADPTDEAFPFRVISRRLKDVLNSCWHDIPGLARRAPVNPAWMNPADMKALGLEDGDLIEVESVRAAITGVCAGAPDVRAGCISMTHAWGAAPGQDDPRGLGANTGRLTAIDQDFDPISGIPRMSAIPVRVRKAV